MNVEQEADDLRLKRLIQQPGTATTADVEWAATRAFNLQQAVDGLKKQAGRFFGLREAAELLEAGAHKSHKVSFLYGKRQQVANVQNETLLLNMARLVRRYAGDAENGTGPFAQAEARVLL